MFRDAIDRVIEAERTRQRIPGLSVALVKGGHVVKAQGYGQANVELDSPATAQTPYQLASVTKHIVASGIVLLQRDGRLRLTDPISAFIPDTPASWAGITLRHLATHTSGLVADEPMDLTLPHTEADAIRLVKPLPLRFTPGAKWEYCNFGFVLLGEVIQKVSGQRWDRFLGERVFGPLGMTSTRRFSLTELIRGRADGYGLSGEAMVRVPSWGRDFASGGLITTVADLARWDAGLRTDRLFRPEDRALMFTPVPLSDGTSYPYGLGWNVTGAAGKREANHGGARPGFSTYFWRELDGDRAVIALCNRGGADLAGLARRLTEAF